LFSIAGQISWMEAGRRCPSGRVNAGSRKRERNDWLEVRAKEEIMAV
jgi:hypothetical protein